MAAFNQWPARVACRGCIWWATNEGQLENIVRLINRWDNPAAQQMLSQFEPYPSVERAPVALPEPRS